MRRHPSSASFFGVTPVFGRAEFAKAVGRHPSDRAVTELLKYHLGAGNIHRVARGVFASVPNGTFATTADVDRFLAASRLRSGGVLAYRSALELHGCATEGTSELQLIAAGEPGLIEMGAFACRFVSPPSGHSPIEGVTTIDRQGMALKVTTLERTLVDVFDRYDLAGGAEDLFRCLDLVALDVGAECDNPLDVDALVDFARRRDNAAAAGALGHWLHHERHRLGVTDAALENLRSLAPRHSRYALGATPGRGRFAAGWNVILPAGIVERYFDD